MLGSPATRVRTDLLVELAIPTPFLAEGRARG
jgi:hypothetical protein